MAEGVCGFGDATGGSTCSTTLANGLSSGPIEAANSAWCSTECTSPLRWANQAVLAPEPNSKTRAGTAREPSQVSTTSMAR